MITEMRAWFSFLWDLDNAIFWDDGNVLYLDLGVHSIEFIHF